MRLLIRGYFFEFQSSKKINRDGAMDAMVRDESLKFKVGF